MMLCDAAPVLGRVIFVGEHVDKVDELLIGQFMRVGEGIQGADRIEVEALEAGNAERLQRLDRARLPGTRRAGNHDNVTIGHAF